MGSGTQEKCNLQSKDCIFSCATHGGNGDHVELRSCGLQSKDDDVCLHWETHVVQRRRSSCSMGSGTQEKCNLQSKDCILSCATHCGNGDHVELGSCDSRSKQKVFVFNGKLFSESKRVAPKSSLPLVRGTHHSFHLLGTKTGPT